MTGPARHEAPAPPAGTPPGAYPLREGLLVFAGILAASGLSLAVLYLEGAQALRQEVRQSLVRTAIAAAGLVDGDLHRVFTKPQQEQGEVYQRAVEPLRRVLQARPDIRFLYTMVLVEDRPHVVLDATPPGDADSDGIEDHSAIMEPYLRDAPALLDALRRGVAQADPHPVRDRWGAFLSGYAPFFDSRGRQAGVVGVDIPANVYYTRLAGMRRAALVGFLTALAISGMLGMTVWRLRRNALTAEGERFAAAEALRHREADFRQMFEQMLDGCALHEIICDASGKPVDYRFLAVNPAFESLTGLRAEQIVGRTVREALPGTEAHWIETYGRVALTGQATHFENYHGELRRHFEVTAYRPRPGQFACIFKDTTESRRAQETLRENEERYRTLVGSLTDALFVHGIDENGSMGRFVEVNDEACRLLGYSRAELLALSPREIEAPDSPVDRESVQRRLAAGGNVGFEGLQVAKDGTRIPVEMRCRVLTLGGRPMVIALATDIRERRRAETERQRIQQHLQHVQKLEGLGLLAGGIAHDFNNLLMVILGNVDLALQDTVSGAPAAPCLEQIKKVSLRAAELCRQMLAYSGRSAFVVAPVDLSRVVRETANLIEVSISKRAVMRYNLAESLPAVEADATQLRQVVMNLVINASEAVAARSGAIALSTGARDCDASCLRACLLGDNARPGLYVFLEVADTGCGMDRETLARVFDPFFTTKFTGRGLGLAAVLGIVRGHRGVIRVTSEPGRGSTFTVLLPAAADPAAPPPAAGSPEAWRGTGAVLLVDDDETVRAVGCRMIERLGFRVLTAVDGRQAVEVFRAHAAELVCVVMDLTMPHMDGTEAFPLMRDIRADIPVVLSSGYSEQDMAQRFPNAGPAGFIQKPYQMADLAAVLRRATASPPPA